MFRLWILPLSLVVLVNALIKPINEDDPELYREWSTPDDLEHYRTYRVGAGFLGNLFAGRAEFPWIVDIRHTDGDVESWTTGNLINSFRVLVSCRAIGYWRRTPDKPKPDELVPFTELKVSYCSTYLWEDYKLAYYRDYVPVDDLRKSDTGTRYVREALAHPECSTTSMVYDIGWLKMKRDISAISPVVDFMSTWFDPTTLRVSNVDLSKMNEQGRVCYIASFGRDYVNWIDHFVNDYKVKYRVYYEDMSKCRAEQNDYARVYNNLNASISHDEEEKLYCFKSRARVGTVCDHDKAAPLVCDDRVYGWVVRGANFSKCNNLFPMTVVVVRALVLDAYYRSIIKTGAFGGKSSASVDYGSFFTVLLFSLISLVRKNH